MAQRKKDPPLAARARNKTRAKAALEHWRAAQRWHSAVEAVLAGYGLTFKQWLVLGATEAMYRETDDAMSQSDLARWLGLDRMTVSRVMGFLADTGLVDRDVDNTGWTYRIILTAKGRALLNETFRAIEPLSARWST